MRPRPRLTALCLALAGLLVGTGAASDPLDKVSGTEGWERAGPEDLEAEWKDWYRGRVEWRRASRELRVQRVVSQRLAAILERSGETSFEQIKRIIIAGMKGLPPDPDAPVAPAPTPAPKAGGKRRPTPTPKVAPEPPEPPPEEKPAPEEKPPPRKPKPKPEDWSKVPVERLDKDGQAIDDEGEKVLKKASQKKRRDP